MKKGDCSLIDYAYNKQNLFSWAGFSIFISYHFCKCSGGGSASGFIYLICSEARYHTTDVEMGNKTMLTTLAALTHAVTRHLLMIEVAASFCLINVCQTSL